MFKDCFKVLLEMLLHNIAYECEEPGSVLVVHKAVIEDAVHFVYKKPDHCSLVRK